MTVLIDKLLQHVVAQNASDMHIAVGVPPVIRIHGRLRPLKTKVLTPEDTMSIMKSITPERCQQELQEVGGCDFGFAFGDSARALCGYPDLEFTIDLGADRYEFLPEGVESGLLC